MSIADPFIRRPVMTTLVMVAILLAGWMGYRQLPVSDLPNVDFPTIQVSASLSGASPETMASAVATTLEREFSRIAGITSMTSSSSKGSTQITLQFDLNRDIDGAAQDVQSAISQAQRSLPEDMTTPPSFRKVNPADSPILFLALTSDNLPLSTVNEYAETFMAQRISMIEGVAQVDVNGQQKYAVRVQLDPRELASRSLGIDEVSQAISNANVNMATGEVDGAHRTFSIETDGQLFDAEAYRQIIVAYRNGSPVRLESLGRVVDSVENDKSAAWFNDTRSVTLSIQRQPGANTVAVVDSIKELLPTFRTQLPPSINIEIVADRSETIRASIHEVQFTLWITICLVVLVIFAFLRSLRATLIPSLALPMSLIGTFAVMHLLGYSIDNLSMMAITLSVGFVVDDAIVVLENIVRHMEQGKSPREAALIGAKEIGFTIVSMTISLVAVFLPVLFMGGILGRLLQQFAITISVAILISGFISLSLTPLLCSRFMHVVKGERHGRLFNASERFFDAMLHFYDRTLKLSLRFHPVMTALFFIVLGATVWLYGQVPKGFLPDEDTGRVFVSTEAQEGISFPDMVRHQRAVAQVLIDDPLVTAVTSNVGNGNTGRSFVTLKPRAEREETVNDFIRRMRPELAQIPGIKSFMQNPPTIRIGGRLSKSQYQYTLQSPDTAELYAMAPKLQEELAADPMFLDVTSDLQSANPQVDMQIDRDKAAALGISVRAIQDALASAYGSRRVSTIYAPNDAYEVIMELIPEQQANPQVLDQLYVRAEDGKLIPLSTITALKSGVGPLSVNHQGQLPSVTLSFNLAPNVSIGDGVERIEELSAQVLPQSITTSFQGTAQAFQESFAGLGLLLIMSVLVIYIVLGILYESFIHPLTILSGLPSAGFGALAALLIFDMQLDLYSFVGIIMLVGIVKKNAIMMIDFALSEQRENNVPPAEAIYNGCLVRFRPIMMTTMATLMGALPIAIGLGGGFDARRPLGVAIIGGLIFSQFLTLYITPIFYIYFEKLRSMRKPRRARAESTPPPSAEPAEA